MDCSSINEYDTCIDNNCCWNNTCIVCSYDNEGSILIFIFAGLILICSMIIVYIIIYVCVVIICKRNVRNHIRVYPYRVETFAEVTNIQSVINESCYDELPKAREVILKTS